jgi:hypothetical protein
MRDCKLTKIWLLALLLVLFTGGCGDADNKVGTASPLSPPTVLSVTPGNGATGVCDNGTVTATFSKQMDPATITTSTFTLVGSSAVAGTVTLDSTGTIATFKPASSLLLNTKYTATITTGAKDLFGNTLASNFVWTFTTVAVSCVPTVVSVTPANGATGVCDNGTVTATFNIPMDPTTINTSTFTLTGPSAVAGTVTLDSTGKIATFTPTSSLLLNTKYTATITTGAKSPSGNALASNFVWTFTTAAKSCIPVPAITLGTACTFAVLAGSTVTNVAGTATTISGDVGVWPGTAISGLTPPATVTGTTHAGDTVAMTAQGDLTTAYNSAAGAQGGAILAADIGGQTLTAGVYKTTSAQPSLGITGSLTLDAQGNPNATFIFQIVSTLTTATNNSSVILINGAQPGNVFWQVGSSATLGTNTVFAGTIMAQASVTLTTRTTLNGRALARAGAVTLDTNTITRSLCPGEVPPVPPTVIAETPPNGATGVCSNQSVTATFSKQMNPATINTSTFTLMGPSAVAGTVTLDSTGTIATFTPSSNLLLSTTYTATITTGAKDLAGDALASNFVWTFTTAAAPCTSPVPVTLGTACSFGILAGSTVTNVAGTATSITGDVGVWPGSAITGLTPPATVIGTTHAADAVAMTAQGDLTTAYNEAAGAPGGAVLTADIGGQTLFPGVYRTTSAQPSLGITGNLTLDAQGNTNATFIFQIVSTLITATNNNQVILINGAQAHNVFWQVGSSATLGTNTIFAGTIMAQASITLTTGATLNGRALARVGAVTMDTNTVVRPSCP